MAKPSEERPCTFLVFLGGLAGQLRAIIDQQVRIQNAENRAAERGNAPLQAVADCSKHQLSAQLQSLAEAVPLVNRLIALINVFAQLAGVFKPRHSGDTCPRAPARR